MCVTTYRSLPILNQSFEWLDEPTRPLLFQYLSFSFLECWRQIYMYTSSASFISCCVNFSTLFSLNTVFLSGNWCLVLVGIPARYPPCSFEGKSLSTHKTVFSYIVLFVCFVCEQPTSKCVVSSPETFALQNFQVTISYTVMHSNLSKSQSCQSMYLCIRKCICYTRRTSIRRVGVEKKGMSLGAGNLFQITFKIRGSSTVRDIMISN